MSKLGYIASSYGKQMNISIANTYSYNVLAGSNLPINSIIIASNIDENNNDTGTYSLIATDNEGNPVRLTYTVKEGNGLYYNTDKDYISLNIDNNVIIEKENQLSFNLGAKLNGNFIIENDTVNVNIDSIPTASKTNYGISAIDGKTVIIDEDKIIRINTDNLMYADNSTNEYGIAIGDGTTIISDNGKIKVNLSEIKKADNDNYGFVISDNNTVNIEDGIINVNTENLRTATSETFGISKPDNKTIVFNSDGNITVNEQNLNIATDKNYGVGKIDYQTLGFTNDNKIYFKDYAVLSSYISEYKNVSDKYTSKIKEYKEYLSTGNVLLRGKDIHQFHINETSVTELIKPKDNEEVINMPLQTVSAVFNIVTTCDFNLSVVFEDGTNEFPNVDLLEVNYNDEEIYDKETALNPKKVYKSTNGEKKKLTVRFSAKNYRNSINSEFLVTSVNIRVSNVEDNLKYKSEKYSIVRYNSLYNTIKAKEDKEKEQIDNKEFYIVEKDTIRWRESKN